ncbi:MAG: gluconolactonase, partial [Candidatus Pelagisphaera sp.]
FPNGVQFSPDQSLLYVSDTRGQFVYSYQIQTDGSLAHKQRYYHLRIKDGSTQTNADGMTVDSEGTLYVTTEMGIQFCDQAGRVKGIINRPQNAWISNVVIGGPNFDQLYATCNDKVYVRSINAKASLSYQSPITPAKPRL